MEVSGQPHRPRGNSPGYPLQWLSGGPEMIWMLWRTNLPLPRITVNIVRDVFSEQPGGHRSEKLTYKDAWKWNQRRDGIDTSRKAKSEW
jgi:hypothetical protein